MGDLTPDEMRALSDTLGAPPAPESDGDSGAVEPPAPADPGDPANRAGILPRLVAGLFASIAGADAADSEFVLAASAVEIYNESIRDLLAGVDPAAVAASAAAAGRPSVGGGSAPSGSDDDATTVSSSGYGGGNPRDSDASFASASTAAMSAGRASLGGSGVVAALMRTSSMSGAVLATSVAGAAAMTAGATDKGGLQLREDPDRGVYVAGAVTVAITSPWQVFQCLEIAMSNRAVAATGMNAQSSRSHSVFQLTVSRRNNSTYVTTRSTLFIVDLAGSEKVSKTGARDERLKEAQNILYSLHALGNVINALTDRKSTHIPYRDSKRVYAPRTLACAAAAVLAALPSPAAG